MHHIAATQIAAMLIADVVHRNEFPLFCRVIAVIAPTVFQHRHLTCLKSRASPFGLCCHFSFRHAGFLFKQ